MTTFMEKEIKCAICGNISKQEIMSSTTTFGSPDLDSRPAPLARSALSELIQKCPSCNYCFPAISEIVGNAEEVVKSDGYQKQLNDPNFPALADLFICSKIIFEKAKYYANAGWEIIHAAWACDDENLDQKAKECRIQAVELFSKARESGQIYAEGIGAEEAILADLLRRTEQFELGLKISEEGLKKKPDKTIAAVLRKEKWLIGKKDVACHPISDRNSGSTITIRG